MREKEHKTHGFPYRHKPLSDYMYNNGIKPSDLAGKISKSTGWVYGFLGMNRPVSASTAIEIMRATDNALTIDELMNPLGVNNGAGSAA